MSDARDRAFNLSMARQHKEEPELFPRAYDEFRQAVLGDPTLLHEIKEAWDAGSWLMGWWAAQLRRRH